MVELTWFHIKYLIIWGYFFEDLHFSIIAKKKIAEPFNINRKNWKKTWNKSYSVDVILAEERKKNKNIFEQNKLNFFLLKWFKLW